MWIDDLVLQECTENITSKLWVPESPMVVLGRSNQADREANVEACRRDAVAIYKRIGGGGTVLLHSGCLVVSVGCWVREFYHNDRYFKALNQAVISTIQSRLASIRLAQRGYSDIVFEDRKIAGTSLFRSRNYLLYQASILIEPRIEAIERYLQHPSAEPAYRSGRSHRDFLTGLDEFDTWGPSEWLAHFQTHFSEDVQKVLAPELIGAQASQIEHVLGRMERD